MTRGFWSQNSRVPFPVHHVLTGNMCKYETATVPVNVVQVVSTVPDKRGIWISREGITGTRMSRVIGQPSLRRILRQRGSLEFSIVGQCIVIRKKNTELTKSKIGLKFVMY